jgi:hypothetical protein
MDAEMKQIPFGNDRQKSKGKDRTAKAKTEQQGKAERHT